MRLSYYQNTDRGQVREINEDFMAAITPGDNELSLKEGSVFVIADGLGGLADGEVASGEAIQTFEMLWRDLPDFQTTQGVRTIFNTINARIFQINHPKESAEWMATTLTASFFYENRLTIGHIGDCRVYQVRHHQIRRLTTDHSFSRNILTRTIGTDPSVQADVYTLPLEVGDSYIQCSDGLYSMVDDQAILDSTAEEDPRKVCEILIASANRRGGLDNITVQVIQVHE